MDATSVYLANKLVEMIEEKQQEMLRPLIQGAAADFPDYQKRAGYLRALGDVISWIGEISAEEDSEGRGPLARSPQNRHASS
jgi:hypothetical protein